MKSTYSEQQTFEGFQQDFTTNSSNGFDLIDVKFGNEDLIAAYGKNIGKSDFFINRTTWDTDANISNLKRTIAAKKAAGYELTDLDYAGGWFSTYGSGEGDSELIEADTYADIQEQLLDLQDLNSSSSIDYQVIDIEYDGKSRSWVAIASVIAGDSTYVKSESFSEFKREIERQSDKRLELSNLEYANGDFIGIYDRANLSGASAISSEFHRDVDDFVAEIEDNRDRGYHLVNTETINGSWFGIYKQDADFGEPLTSSSGRAPVFDPVQNTLRTITQQTLLNSVFD